MKSKALLFLNGEPPKNTDFNFANYKLVGCTDGAYMYAKNLKLDFVIGDFDSINLEELSIKELKFIHKKGQNSTDFDKALKYLLKNEITQVDVYGASGKEQDHFLGNISTALKNKNKINITFFDDFGKYYLLEKQNKIDVKNGIIISLIPIKKVKNITTKGLKYKLENEDLTFGKCIGTRNTSISDKIEINFSKGEMLIYIQN